MRGKAVGEGGWRLEAKSKVAAKVKVEGEEGLSGLSGLFCSSDQSNRIDQRNQTNQIDQINRSLLVVYA